jgi:hypothetical protein
MNKKVLIGAGITLAALILVVVVVKFGSKGTGGTPTATGTPETPAMISYDTAAPADWVSYASPSAGFRLSYPKDWAPGPCGPGCVAFGPASASGQLLIGVTVSTQSLADVASQAAPYQLSQGTVTIGSATWLKVVLKEPYTGALFTSHFLFHAGKLYEVGMATQQQSAADVYGKMLRSFSLTK